MRTYGHDITAMPMYLIELFFRKKKMYSVTSLIYLVIVAFAVQSSRDFFVSNSFVVLDHITCRSPVSIARG